MPDAWQLVAGLVGLSFSLSLSQLAWRWALEQAWQRGKQFVLAQLEHRLMAARAPRPEIVEPEPLPPEEMSVARPGTVVVDAEWYQQLLQAYMRQNALTWQGILVGFCVCLALIVVIVVLVALYSILAVVMGG